MQRRLTAILSADLAAYTGTHVELREFEAALDLLGPAFEKNVPIEFLNCAKTDPDLDLIRDHPRFKTLLAAADMRLTKS